MKLFILVAVLVLVGCVVNGFDGDLDDWTDRVNQQLRGGSDRPKPNHHYSFEWPPIQRKASRVESMSPEERQLTSFFNRMDRAIIEDVIRGTGTTTLTPKEGPLNPEDIDNATLLRLQQDMQEHILSLQKKAMEDPPALKELFYGGNTSTSINQDKEVECVVKCQPTMQGNPKFEEYGCLELGESVDCVAKCRPGVFADFVYGVVKTIHHKSCSADQVGGGSFDLKKLQNEINYKALSCTNTILSDLKTVVGVAHHLLGCYSEVLDAHNTKEACYAVKYCVVDSTINKMKSVCRDDDMAELVKFTSIYAITVITRNGNLIRNCPSLYTMD